jgi:hypothetical protein
MAEENWLDGVCNYTGPGADLPLGGYTKISGWAPQILVKTWAILDAEADEGFAEKKTSELKATDIIIGCTMNANSIKKIVEMFGKDFYQIRDANGGPLMTLDKWQAKYHSNGLGLVAIRNMIMKLRGRGVHFGAL